MSAVDSGDVFADLGCEDSEFERARADVGIAYDEAIALMAGVESIPLAMAAKDMAALLEGPLDDGGGFTWAKLHTRVSMAVMRDIYDEITERGNIINDRFKTLIADIESGRYQSLDRVDGSG